MIWFIFAFLLFRIAQEDSVRMALFNNSETLCLLVSSSPMVFWLKTYLGKILETCCGPEFFGGRWPLLWLSVPEKSRGSFDAMKRAPSFWEYCHHENNGLLSIFFSLKKKKDTKGEGILTDIWGNKCGLYKPWDISVFKRKEFLMHATTWMNLDHIMLGKIM